MRFTGPSSSSSSALRVLLKGQSLSRPFLTANAVLGMLAMRFCGLGKRNAINGLEVVLELQMTDDA